jgi:hypothetical protein
MKGLDFEARQATLGNMVYNAQSVARYLLPITKQRMLDEWQKSWVVAETGRFSHSIFPRVSLRPWFEEWRTEWKLITITTLKDYLGALRSSSPPETFQHCWWKHVCRGGLAPQILVGFFFKGPLKKKNCCKNKIADLKKQKTAAQTESRRPNRKLTTNQADLKKNRSWCWGAPDCLRGPQSRGTPWDFSHLVIWLVRPCMCVCPEDHVDHIIWKCSRFCLNEHALASKKRPRYEICVPNWIGGLLESVLCFSLNVAWKFDSILC